MTITKFDLKIFEKLNFQKNLKNYEQTKHKYIGQ